jgi:hypothetical protein
MATTTSSDNTDRPPDRDHRSHRCSCEAYSSTDGASLDSVPSTPGRLVWLCPICGHAWPRYAAGDRGRLALSLSGRLNHHARSASAWHSYE